MLSLENLQLASGAKLRGSENYSQWKSQMLVLLESKDLENYIEIATTKPEEPVAGKAWKTNNAKAKLAIINNVLQEPATLITDIPTASQMWESLRNQYQGSGHNLKQSYLSEIQSIDFKQFNSMPAFIVRFKSLVANLANVDLKLPDDVYTILFINALSSAFPI